MIVTCVGNALMSYMRGEYYAFPVADGAIVLHGGRTDCGCGRHRQFPVILLPLATFDELVVMRFAELVQDEKVLETITRTAESGRFGNGGAGALANICGP